MPRRFRTLLALALPMVVARASQSVITFADAIQVRDLGPKAIAATATGGLNVMAFVVLAMGTVFIVQSFVAQLAGRGQREQTTRFAWYGLALAFAAGVVAIVLIPIVEPLLSFTGYSPGVRDAMAQYMAIRLLSVGAIVGAEALGNWYGGLGNTWMQMIAGIITMVCAVVLNWVLIGGHLGAPAMGVNGTAVASTIASFIGFGFLAIAFWRGWGGAPRPQQPRGLTWSELRRVVRFGLPNGLNWFLEFAAFQIFVNFVIAGLGDTTVAAFNVVLAVNSIAFMPAFGLASAGAILAAQAIGRGARDEVWQDVRLTLACTISWMVAVASAYMFAPRHVLGWFAPEGVDSAQLIEVGSSMLVISALWQVFDATGITLAETLRAAGDTSWPAKVRILIAWFVFTPAAYVVVNLSHGGAVGAMLCLVGYLALVALALGLRFRSGAWRSIELIEPQLV
ncbi:MAG: Multidrug and toxin extrusion family efflux pump YdhE/NorM [Myxococcales bacterium]|nr:Multidrug and toxin extrusion family efflux pump YdhE/NorM [Myxococcales bacterium]